MALSLQPVRVAVGDDEDGVLVFRDGRLVAVLVRLSDLHDEDAGRWFLEKGFGDLDGPPPGPFASLDAAQDWIMGRLALPPAPRKQRR